MEEILYQMIFKRKSFHRFRNTGTISQEELTRIAEAFHRCRPLIPEIRTEMRIVPGSQTTCKRGQEYCILLYSEKKEGYLPNIGYIGEQLDLLLAVWNIGALWFGIGKTEVQSTSGLDFVIMIAIAKMEETQFRKDMFKSMRKPLEEIWFGKDDLGIANIVRFAPSACNTQPWIVERDGNAWKVFRCKKPGKRGIMPADKVVYYNRIDIGIFLLFLEVCLNHNQIRFDRLLYQDHQDGEKNSLQFTRSEKAYEAVTDMEIRELEKWEYPTALRLAWKVFLEFETPDYSQEGVETFRKLLEDRNFEKEIRVYGAFEADTIVGMLATRRNGEHITLFFVDGNYHRQGIGKALFALAVRDNHSGKMTVNSSPYAVHIYPHLGFHPTGPEELADGIRFTHMELELLDVVDENGMPTGEVVPREKAHAEGIRHRTSHVWLVRSRGENIQILLQKRCESKDSWPGCYDISSAGHIPAGADFIPSAIRELQEELGVQAVPEELIFCGNRSICADGEFHGRFFHDRQYSRVFALWRDQEEADFRLQKEEIDSVCWMNLDACIEAVKNDTIPHCIYLEELEMVKAAVT